MGHKLVNRKITKVRVRILKSRKKQISSIKSTKAKEKSGPLQLRNVVDKIQ